MIPDISVARPQRNYRWLLWLVAAIVFATDQLSKAYVASQLDLWERWQPFDRFPLNLFAITHTSNTGAAFGILPEFGLFFVIVAIVVSGAIAFYYRRLPSDQWWLFISLGLQLGGALGNLADRLRLGYVVDFVEIGIIPVFNFADNAIVLGVGMLAWHLWREEQQQDVSSEEHASPATEVGGPWPDALSAPTSRNGHRHLAPEEADQLLHGDNRSGSGDQRIEPPSNL